eukprot:g2399.t1
MNSVAQFNSFQSSFHPVPTTTVHGGSSSWHPVSVQELESYLSRILRVGMILLEGDRPQEALDLIAESIPEKYRDKNLLFLKGRCLSRLMRTSEALDCFSEVLVSHPTYIEAMVSASEIHHNRGEYELTLQYLRKANQIDPENKDVRYSIAMVLTDQGIQKASNGDADGSLRSCLEALEFFPYFASAHYNLGIHYGNSQQAMEHYKKAVECDPSHTMAWTNLGVIFKTQGDFSSALECYNKAIKLDPEHSLILANMASALVGLGEEKKAEKKPTEAIEYYEEALYQNPACIEALCSLAAINTDLGRLKHAIFYYETAIIHNNKSPEIYCSLGVLYGRLGNKEKELKCYHNAIAIKPNHVTSICNIGVTYMSQGKIRNAIEMFKKVVSLDPQHIGAYNNLAILHKDIGHTNESVQSYEKCLQISPQCRYPAHNYLMGLNYSVPGECSFISNEHLNWGLRMNSCIPQLPPITPTNRNPDPNRILKIGYLSPDLHFHSVSYFAEAPLCHHRPEQVHITVYDASPICDFKKQLLQKGVQSLGGQWINVEKLSEEDLAELIRKDNIDILVDLSGHTAHNRLGTLAMKPAPIQVTWIGYPNSTGLRQVDYRITDAYCDPETTEQVFTERLIRVPGSFLCYTPIPNPPQVAPAPCLVNEFVTFGCFNNIAKITPEVIEVWSEILRTISSARLVMKNKTFACEENRERFMKQFESHGVRSYQLDLIPYSQNVHDHLCSYSRMDISLDPWPYAGTTTTCESLLMGVPCLTLAGKCHAQNVGVSLIHAVGLSEDWIARNRDDYIQRAINFASDFRALAQLRERLRSQMLSSELCDARQHVTKIEASYRFIFDNVLDIGPGLNKLEENPRAVFTAFQLNGIASTIHNAFQLAEQLETNPVLYPIIQPVTSVNSTLLTELQTSIRESDGFILDEASEDLKDRRIDRESNREQLQKELESWVKLLHKQGACERPIIVCRRDRQCIPVRNGRQGHLPKGSVRLSQSSSGSTVYMEPEPVIQLNNKEALLHSQIRHHEKRVLTRLTQMVLEQRETLQLMMKALAELDVICACSRHAKWIGGVKPRFLDGDNNDTFQVHVPSAIHPLLLENSRANALPKAPSLTKRMFSEGFQQPLGSMLASFEEQDPAPVSLTHPQSLNLTIPSTKRVVALTGPNTGGKTATLKTLGLCVLMAKSGLYIPVENPTEEVYLKWFDKVLVDIGDSQSLQQSLSTFTGHVRRVNKILDEVCDNSLVLLDEIGTGTDPTEGAALGSSILCTLSEISGLTVATTHHAEIKELADHNPAFLNASMEFNAQTLKPTYRLIWGSMGQSNALEICSALSFDPKIVHEAKKWLEKGILQAKKEHKLEDSLRQKLEETHAQKEALIDVKKDAKKRLDIMAEQLRLLRLKEESLMERLTKYGEFVQEVDKEVDQILKEAKNDNLTPKEAESCLKELKDRGLKLDPSSTGVLPTWYPEFNEVVRLRTMGGILGTVLSKSPGRIVQIQSGNMKLELPIWDIEKVDPENLSKQKPKRKSIEVKQTSLEIDAYGELELDDKSQKNENTIDLRGLYVDDALEALERDLETQTDVDQFYVVHGHGTGTLRAAIRDYLRTCKIVRSFEDSSDGVSIPGTIRRMNSPLTRYDDIFTESLSKNAALSITNPVPIGRTLRVNTSFKIAMDAVRSRVRMHSLESEPKHFSPVFIPSAKEQKSLGEILSSAGRRALGGGIPGMTAMAIQVLSLMWLRTTVNYQYRYGTGTLTALRTLYSQGGVRRFYRGVGPALIQGPLSRFGDTAANTGMLALLDSYENTAGLPIGVKTGSASLAAACWRIFLMPVDTCKTILQVEGRDGLQKLRGKLASSGPPVLYHGALAAAGATAVGHYPWFATYNYLNAYLPQYDLFHQKLMRSAVIGFSSSFISDTCSNSIRVVKTTRQTSTTPMTYPQVVTHILQADGVSGLMFRGLKTKILTNGLQGIMFTVIWRLGMDWWNKDTK